MLTRQHLQTKLLMPDLSTNPFAFQLLKSDRVRITCQGKHARTVSGKEAVKLIARLEQQSEGERQLTLAKVTGQFKFGNEKAQHKDNAAN